jgi:hypothetical protein
VLLDSRVRQASHRWGTLALVWLFAGCYAYAGLNRGWVPHDEGQFAQTADRILAGEMPHRDFDEMYTGALSYANAAAFRILGQDLRSLRFVLFGVFLLWVPAVYSVASRFGSSLTAGAVTALAAVWSIPNYPSPVPSWYNLFFAVFGLAATLRYVETDRRRWLFVAGVCGGLSFLVKLVGLYFVAGILLFLVSREQSQTSDAHDRQAGRSRLYSAAVCVGLLAFVALLVRAFSVGLTLPKFMVVLLPPVGASSLLIWREIQRPPASSGPRLRKLLRLALPFLAGVVLPVALFLIPFAAGAGLQALYRDVFVLPQRRLISASYTMAPLNLLLTAPLLAVVWIVLALRRPVRGFVALVTLLIGGGALAAVLVYSRSSETLYQLAWRPAVYMMPLAVLSAVWLFRRLGDSSDVRHQQAMLVIFVTAMCGLVQLPFPAPIYFCYVAPLVVLTMVALFSLRHATGSPLALALVAFYALFAAFRVTPGAIYVTGHAFAAEDPRTPLLLSRARTLRVGDQQAQVYNRLVPLVTQVANGGALYASPDCPEVYFLTGLPNPTRTIYEFLSEPRATTADLLTLLAARHVTVVVINTTPEFSGQMPADLRAALRVRYPATTSVGPFEVRWLE